MVNLIRSHEKTRKTDVFRFPIFSVEILVDVLEFEIWTNVYKRLGYEIMGVRVAANM